MCVRPPPARWEIMIIYTLERLDLSPVDRRREREREREREKYAREEKKRKKGEREEGKKEGRRKEEGKVRPPEGTGGGRILIYTTVYR